MLLEGNSLPFELCLVGFQPLVHSTLCQGWTGCSCKASCQTRHWCHSTRCQDENSVECSRAHWYGRLYRLTRSLLPAPIVPIGVVVDLPRGIGPAVTRPASISRHGGHGCCYGLSLKWEGCEWGKASDSSDLRSTMNRHNLYTCMKQGTKIITSGSQQDANSRT